LSIKLFRFLLPALLILSFSCKKDKNVISYQEEIDYSQITDIIYSNHVQKIFDNNCISCHSGKTAESGLRFDSWDELIVGSKYGEVIIPFDSENSLMIEMLTKLTGGSHPAELKMNTLSGDAVKFLARWIDEGAKNDAGEIPYENSINKLYVCSQDAAIVSIIDTDAKTVIRNINIKDLGFSAGSKPHHIAVTPDGSSWFVSLIGANKVLKFDNQYNKVAESIDISIPALLAVHPSQNLLFVSRFMDFNNPLNSIVVLNRQTMQPPAGLGNDGIPVLFDIPHSMVIDHSGQYAYTASLSQNQLIAINTLTLDTEDFIALGNSKGPLQIAVSPNDSILYISCQISNQMLVADVSNPAARSIVDSINVGAQPWHPVFTPDGSRVYVGNFGSNEVTVINTSGSSVEKVITGNGIAQPHGIAASNDGKYVYVSSRNVNGLYTPRHNFGDNANIGTVAVINTLTNEIEKVIEIEEFGSGMAIWEQ